MPMNGATLATAVKSTLSGQGFTFGPGAMNTKFVDALCAALVAHIQANAVVSGPVTVTSVSGVTPGGGVSGPGAGTLAGGTIL
jgi:hypothetical protein